MLIELFLKRIKWLEAHTNIVETLPEKGDILEAAVQEDAVIFKPKVLFDRKSVGASSTEDIPKARSGKGVGQ